MNWNEIPKQKHLVGNPEGIPGDCWRCCITAVLGLPAEEVPHFLHESPQGCMTSETQRWLNARGYILWKEGEHYTHGGSEVFLPSIVCGPTVRSKKQGDHHAVVTNGWNLLYDPHPDSAGVLYEADTWRIFKLPHHP